MMGVKASTGKPWQQDWLTLLHNFYH